MSKAKEPMKKVILTKPESQVTEVKDVSFNKYYGMTYYGGKAFLTTKEFATREEGATFIWLCRDFVNHNNKICLADGYSSVQEAIEYAIQNKMASEVYEFNTDRELFKWLAAD